MEHGEHKQTPVRTVPACVGRRQEAEEKLLSWCKGQDDRGRKECTGQPRRLMTRPRSPSRSQESAIHINQAAFPGRVEDFKLRFRDVLRISRRGSMSQAEVELLYIVTAYELQ